MRLEQAPRGWGSHYETAVPRLSIVVPVHDGAAALPACLKALIEALGPSREIIVSDDGSLDRSATIAAAMGAITLSSSTNRGAGAARNAGAAEAQADILVFVDADVVIHSDALMRIACFFDDNPNYAALFGSYDAEPTAPNFVSQYRNLLHHFTHQNGRFEAETFWTGLGAIRRSVFEQANGFRDDPCCIEDVELGLSLRAEGFRIALDPNIRGTHLKTWTLGSMVQTDLFRRAIPWSLLLLKRGRLTTDLNTNANGRLGVASVLLAAASLLMTPVWSGFALLALAAIVAALLSIRPLLGHLRRERGVLFAVRSIPVHLVHLFCAGTGFLIALLLHVARGFPSDGRRPLPRPVEAPASSVAAASS